MTPHAHHPRRLPHPTPARRAATETLEGRRLLASIGLSAAGQLSLTGNLSTANTISFDYAANKKTFVAAIGAQKTSYSLTAVKSLQITGGNLADKITIGSSVTLGSVIRPGNGSDTVYGGAGNDVVTDPSGGNKFYMGAGNDSVSGSAGNDTIDGGDGNDTLYGNGGKDLITGDAGNDYADGGSNTDSFDGGTGTDTAVNVEAVKNVEKTTGSSTPTAPTSPTSPTTPTTPTTPPVVGNTNEDLPVNSKAATPTPVITAIDTTLTVGQALFVHGLNSKYGAGTQDTAHFEWNFGDSGGAYNTLVGFNAAHAYDKAGTYTVTLKLWNEDYGFKQTSITVKVAAAGRKLIYVSADGSDSNDGSSQAKAVKTVKRAAALISKKGDVEVLFHAGDTFSVSSTLEIDEDNVRLGSYGSGAKPVLSWNGARDHEDMVRTEAGAHGSIIEGLTFDSIYKGPTDNRTGMPFAINVKGVGAAIRDCTFLNLGYAIQTNAKPTGVLVQDNDAPTLYGLHDYFVWAQGSDFVILGNTVANSTNEHPIRVYGVDRMLLAYNDLANPQAYSFETSKTALNIQKGNDVYVWKNTLRGPRWQVGPLGGADGTGDKSARLNDIVIEDNKVLNTQMEIDHGAGNIYIRNNVFSFSDTNALEVEAYNSQYGRGVSNLNVVNNTFINNGTRGRVLSVDGNVAGITLVDNLYRADAMYVGTYGTAAVYVNDTSLHSFTKISNNVWPVPTVSRYYADNVSGGTAFAFLGTDPNNLSSYYSLSRWNALSQVGTDSQADVVLNSSYKPTSQTTLLSKGLVEWPGVFGDYNGASRDLGDDWTIGAVQL